MRLAVSMKVLGSTAWACQVFRTRFFDDVRDFNFGRSVLQKRGNPVHLPLGQRAQQLDEHLKRVRVHGGLSGEDWSLPVRPHPSGVIPHLAVT